MNAYLCELDQYLPPTKSPNNIARTIGPKKRPKRQTPREHSLSLLFGHGDGEYFVDGLEMYGVEVCHRIAKVE